MKNSRDGILLIDKNEGKTSFKIVKAVRQIINVKKVGHAGTLDPFATGLLIILVGQGTKLFPFIMSEDKEYVATLTLGTETDTLDLTGSITKTSPIGNLSCDIINETARRFTGEIMQRPPAFSAVKYQGKPAYRFARKGIEVELRKRAVDIHEIEILEISLPDVTMRVRCSSGTYIRSLASDMGKSLGTVAHLKSLRRISCGSFFVDEALSSEKTSEAFSLDILTSRLIGLRDAIPGMLEIEIDEGTASKVRRGLQLEWEDLSILRGLPAAFEGHVKLVEGSDMVAVMKVRKQSEEMTEKAKITRVFN